MDPTKLWPQQSNFCRISKDIEKKNKTNICWKDPLILLKPFCVWETTDTNTTPSLHRRESRCICWGDQSIHAKTVPIPTTDPPDNPDNAI